MSLAIAAPLSDARFCVPGPSAEEAGKFGYDATEPKGKRRAARQYTTGEDRILDQSKRNKLTANGRDLARNFAIAAWMIRRHLDYVATFDFQCRTGNVDLDERIEKFVARWEKKWNFDRAGRHSRARALRLTEIRRVVDGDVGWLKLASNHLQFIESDRIKNPTGELLDAGGWVNGVRVDDGGRAKAYAIWDRTKTGLRFNRSVPARNLELVGYFDRFDQFRGISPLTTALNPLRDLYEGIDLALMKMKVAQLLAMIFYTESSDGVGTHTALGDGDETPQKYEVDFGQGPIKLELDPGDRAEFLDTKHPSSEFQAFIEVVLQIAIKALDIPYSFYNESFTNFFGSRAAWLHYQRSAKAKQGDLKDLLDDITFWRLSNAVLDDELELPRGMAVADIEWEWVPRGMPWWDPGKEINGDLLAIGAGLDNPQRIVKERGRGDWYKNVDQIAEAIAYAKRAGVPLSFLPQTIELNVRQETEE